MASPVCLYWYYLLIPVLKTNFDAGSFSLTKKDAAFIKRSVTQKPNTAEQKVEYKKALHDITLEVVRTYNKQIPVIQNMDFGHTDPQIALPYGGKVRIDSQNKKIFATF